MPGPSTSANRKVDWDGLKYFVIVEDENLELMVVPKTWLAQDLSGYWFPPTKRASTVDRLIKEDARKDVKTWSFFPAVVLGHAGELISF